MPPMQENLIIPLFQLFMRVKVELPLHALDASNPKNRTSFTHRKCVEIIFWVTMTVFLKLLKQWTKVKKKLPIQEVPRIRRRRLEDETCLSGQEAVYRLFWNGICVVCCLNSWTWLSLGRCLLRRKLPGLACSTRLFLRRLSLFESQK